MAQLVGECCGPGGELADAVLQVLAGICRLIASRFSRQFLPQFVVRRPTKAVAEVIGAALGVLEGLHFVPYGGQSGNGCSALPAPPVCREGPTDCADSACGYAEFAAR